MHWSRELLALTAGVRWRIAGLVVIGLLIVAASLASFVCAGRAIAAVFAGRAWSDFWFLIAAAAVAAVVRGVLLYLRETAGERTAAAVKQALRTRLYRHLLVLGPGYLERRRTGELVASAVDGVEQLETYYGKYLPQLLVTMLAPIGILIYLWSLDPPLAVVMGVFLPLALLGPWLFRKATSSSGNWHWRAYASFAALVLDSLQGLPTLKAFARGKARGQEIAEQSRDPVPGHHADPGGEPVEHRRYGPGHCRGSRRGPGRWRPAGRGGAHRRRQSAHHLPAGERGLPPRARAGPALPPGPEWSLRRAGHLRPPR